MKIAITGGTGMLGQALIRAFSNHRVYSFSSQDLDVTSLEAVRGQARQLKPDWILHAAAFTAVDQCETEVEKAYQVNALGARNVALAAEESGSRLLYYSSDFVFDGTKKNPYREWDQPNALSHYGKSKLAGEMFVRSLCPQHLVVRTSWLFGPGGAHFILKILGKAECQKELEVVSDQFGSPTFTVDLAYMTLCLVEGGKHGIYHVTNSGSCSWFDLACEAVSLAGLEAEVKPVSSAEFPSPARRPAYSVLENYMLVLEGTPLLRSWRGAVEAFLGGAVEGWDGTKARH